MTRHLSRVPQLLHWLFASWRFPAFILFVLFFYELFLGAILLAPDSGGPFAEFAREFKMWCLGYDPSTKTVQPMSVIMMVTEPAALSATLAIVWWVPLRNVLRTPRALVPCASLAFIVSTAGGVALGLLASGAEPQGELPFPAERLRTERKPPALRLTDHDGREVTLEELRGRVVVMTAVYASCDKTCPMIMAQAKRAVEALTPEEREDLTIVGVTLDPDNDTPAVMKAMAEAQEVRSPYFRLATGEPARVNALLDEMGIARARNPETGVIDHANVFLVVDRGGRVAYTFTLGERQERWLQSALRLLIAERPPQG